MTDAPVSKLSKALLWDYFILIARIWLAITLIKYGYSKLIDGQFGVTDATMQLKDVGLFNSPTFQIFLNVVLLMLICRKETLQFRATQVPYVDKKLENDKF